MINKPKTLKIEQANKSDWEDILSILKESNMDFWMNKGQDYKDFYKILEDGNLICTFALLSEGSHTILRHFTLSKKCQGKGYGKDIANNLLPGFLKSMGMQKVFLLCDNKEPYTSYHFWKKTRYIVLENNAIVPNLFKEYMDDDASDHPDYVDTRYAFCLNLDP